MICHSCSGEGYFVSGVPGVLVHVYAKKYFVEKWVERCDTCEVYSDDAAAVSALLKAGFSRWDLSRPLPRDEVLK